MRTGWLAGLAVAAVLVGVLVAGCGQPASGGPVLDSSVAAGPSGSASAGACAAAGLTITNADNGKTICVQPGAKVVVLLRNGSGPIQASGPLTPRPDGMMMLMRGETGAAFTAGRTGVATITSAISPCASPSGTMHCMVLESFRVQVQIHAA